MVVGRAVPFASGSMIGPRDAEALPAMDGNPAAPAGSRGGASEPDEVSPWPRTGEFTLPYEPPPTDLGGGFLPSETSAIPLGPLYLQTPYRDRADEAASTRPAAYPEQAYGQSAPPSRPDLDAIDVARYEQPPAPSPWQEQPSPSPWPPVPAAPPVPPGPPVSAPPPTTPTASTQPASPAQSGEIPWQSYGGQSNGGQSSTWGHPVGPVDASADYGVSSSDPYGQWAAQQSGFHQPAYPQLGYQHPDQGPSSSGSSTWFALTETGAIPIGPSGGPPPRQRYPDDSFAGPPAEQPGTYQDSVPPGVYDQNSAYLDQYGQHAPYAGQAEPSQSYQVASHQLEYYAYQQTIYQQPPEAPENVQFPAATDPAVQTGAFPLYYPPPPTDLSGSGFTATETSAIPIMPAPPVWPAALSPDPVPADAAWSYPSAPAWTGDPWPATTALPDVPAFTDVPSGLPATAPLDARHPAGTPAEDPGTGTGTDEQSGDVSPPVGAKQAAAPAAGEPAAGPRTPARRRSRRRRRRRIAVLTACCLVMVAIAGTTALSLVSTGDSAESQGAAAPRTLATGGAQRPSATRSYPFPVIVLTQLGGAGAPDTAGPSPAAVLPPGAALGEALGGVVRPPSAGAAPSIGKPAGPTAVRTTTGTPASGNFPPAPPALFPVPGA